jgi:Fe-S oxidoreductase
MTLLRQLAAGTMDPRNWSSEELRENADLCVHCRLCESECPSGVDVSSLMLEAKTAHVERHGLSPEMWMLSRVDLWARLAMRMPALYHALTANRFVRWGLEKAFGLARLRDLPRVTGEPFARWVRRMGLNRPQPQRAGPRVAYFVDIYGTSFAPEIPIAVVSVLQNAGVNVYVPDRQRGCGMPALVAGDLDRAREMLLSNLRVFANAVREGYTVICSEPTAALMLTFESLRLTDDLDAALVAANTLDAGHYLLGLIEAGHAPEPHLPVRVRAGYHQPCHLRSLNIGTPGLTLLDRIPELSVEFMNRGCSGMAGTFGLAARNYRLSLRAGRPLRSRLRQSDLELGTTECSACRMQMEQGLPKRTYHPFELLSLAYGLNPSLLRGLKEPKPRTFRKKDRQRPFGTHHVRHSSHQT